LFEQELTMAINDGMSFQKLGRSGLAASRIVLGAMNFGDRTDEAEARRIVDSAAEHGVNFIDTAIPMPAADPRRSLDQPSPQTVIIGFWRRSSPTRRGPASISVACRANG
jgi:hypothetical protein